MFKKILSSLLFFFAAPLIAFAQIQLETSAFGLDIDNRGHVAGLRDRLHNRNYLPDAQEAPLLSICIDGKIELPGHGRKDGEEIVLQFPDNDITARIRTRVYERYLSFELVEISHVEKIDWVLWGPFPTAIGETVGECVGVVRNADFAIGIQALNVKTLGGYPSEDSDIEPAYSIFDTDNLVDVGADWKSQKSYRGQTGRATDFGSVLQAYTRNRLRERLISNWGHTHYVAPAFDDGGVPGSKIALFGSEPGTVLDIIAEIEKAEGLPHPIIDEVWGKKDKQATASYLIIDFGESDIDRALDLTEKAGLKHLYHGHPFASWGHYDLIESMFPDNWVSMKRCADRAAARGIGLGVHTLTNFINTHDPYVTPIPDPRLAKVGASVLTQSIDQRATEMPVASPVFFNQMENNTLRSVMIGNEIIRYREVSAEEPWRLLDCVRGAYGTRASQHEAGAVVGKLMDHAYKVFLSDAALSEEIAIRIARFCNETGIKLISFDGLEGVWSTGMGQYARSLFTKTWYDHLDPAVRGRIINDASNPSHFNWHINTRYNWGEPWFAGFRESQTYYRLMNQDFYQRNFIPAMLGWFSMTPQTSLEDTEWLLARAAGFDAGFALNLRLESAEQNGQSEAIFRAINNWESARMAGVFSQEQKLRMQDISNEFHLEAVQPGAWRLFPHAVVRHTHQQQMRQPGEPVESTFVFDNPYGEQTPGFIITCQPGENQTGGRVESIKFEINDIHAWDLPYSLEAHQYLKPGPGGVIEKYDRNGNLIGTYTPETKIPLLIHRRNHISVDVRFNSPGASKLHIELKTTGPAEELKATTP